MTRILVIHYSYYYIAIHYNWRQGGIVLTMKHVRKIGSSVGPNLPSSREAMARHGTVGEFVSEQEDWSLYICYSKIV